MAGRRQGKGQQNRKSGRASGHKNPAGARGPGRAAARPEAPASAAPLLTGLRIRDVTEEGSGVGRAPDGMAVFVPGALPGDVVTCRLTKVKKRFAQAELCAIEEPSPDRLETFCPYDADCGGCPCGRLRYEAQLALGQQHVRDVLTRIAGIEEPVVRETLGMPDALDGEGPAPVRCRNKAVLQVGRGADGAPLVGFYARKTHRIVDCTDCLLQAEPAAAAAEALRAFLREEDLPVTGMTVRSSREHEVMIILTLPRAAQGSEDREAALERLVVLLDDAVTDEVWSLESVWLEETGGKSKLPRMTRLAGSAVLRDWIGELALEVSPTAFLQVNPVQTERLYDKAAEYAVLAPGSHVLDLYCGVGSIGLYLAKKMQDSIHLIGIEENPEAIRDANRNAVINGLVNARFFAGRAEEVLPELLQKQAGSEEGALPPADLAKTDVVILDPPRAGCDETLLTAAASLAPERIVYISCEPATLARDINYLAAQGYALVEATPADMFPHTGRIETVVQLINQNAKAKHHVNIGVDADDYYRIKDSKKEM